MHTIGASTLVVYFRIFISEFGSSHDCNLALGLQCCLLKFVTLAMVYRLEFYETKQELMNLKESFVGLVAAIRKMRNLQLVISSFCWKFTITWCVIRQADDVIESLNAAEATAMTKNNSPHVLGSFASHLQIHDRGPVHSPMLSKFLLPFRL